MPDPKSADEETDAGDVPDAEGSDGGESTPAQPRHRLAWAVLLARVFQFDLTDCDQCGGQVKIAAAAERRALPIAQFDYIR